MNPGPSRQWPAAGLLLALSLIGGCSHPVGGEPGASTPEAAVRQAIASELGIPVSLEIDIRNAYANWVFLAGRPLTEHGRPIDYSRTPYAADLAEGYFDDQFTALVERSDARNGAWAVVELAIGATDAPFVAWPDRHGLPQSLVMPESGGQ